MNLRLGRKHALYIYSIGIILTSNDETNVFNKKIQVIVSLTIIYIVCKLVIPLFFFISIYTFLFYIVNLVLCLKFQSVWLDLVLSLVKWLHLHSMFNYGYDFWLESGYVPWSLTFWFYTSKQVVLCGNVYRLRYLIGTYVDVSFAQLQQKKNLKKNICY